MKINGTTRTLGLIGNPVEHTMSPVIHNTLGEELKQNVCYVPFHVETGRLKDAIAGAFALNILGLNVTVPYKSDVIPYLVDIDPLAKTIGACNTLVRTDKGFKGYNTDMPGLYRAMVSDGVKIEGRDILILGAGGVARAVAIMCATNRARSITILNRTIDKALQVANEVMDKMDYKSIRVASNDTYRTILDRDYIAIQCTNVGMYPNVDQVVISDKKLYEHIKIGYDLIFNPKETVFMKLVKENNHEAYNGLKMLLYQGIIAYELWNHVSVSEHMAKKIYEKMEREMGIRS